VTCCTRRSPCWRPAAPWPAWVGAISGAVSPVNGRLWIGRGVPGLARRPVGRLSPPAVGITEPGTWGQAKGVARPSPATTRPPPASPALSPSPTLPNASPDRA
jgi:hypothetical protein